NLLSAQRPAERASDGLHLLSLCQGFRPGHDILRARVNVVAQRTNGDGRDVTLIGRCGWRVEVRPADNVTAPNLRSPEMAGGTGEHAGAHEGPLPPRRPHQPP